MSAYSGTAAIVNGLYEAFARKDEAQLRRLLAPDVEWIQMKGMPGGAHRHGQNDVIEGVLYGLNTAWTDFRVHLADWIVDGSKVVVTGRYRASHTDTGKALDAPFAHYYTVVDGRIARFQQFTDTALFVSAAQS